MLRLAAAEIRYGAGSLAAWLAVMLVMSFWPLLETPAITALPAVLAFLYLVLPITAVISAFRLLSIERNEGRLRLFGGLPVSTASVALARQVRGSALPVAVLLLTVLLSLAGLVGMGREFLSIMSSAWVLGMLFFASLAAVALVTLLYDLGGMSFAQVAVALIVGVVFVANAYGGGFVERALQAVSVAAQTPAGLVAAAAVCVGLWTADVAVLKWRGGR